MLVSVLLPDAFALAYSQDELANMPAMYGYAVVRWLAMVNFVVLPIAVFYKNRTIRNIAIYFGMLVTILQICFYPQYLLDFTSSAGKGLNSISIISDGVKSFLINPIFRSIWFGAQIVLQMIIPVVLAIQEKHVFNFKDGKEYLHFFLCLPMIVLASIPVYLPQHLFGYTNLIFSRYGVIHFCWVVFMVFEIAGLYFVFRRRDPETKMVVLLVLAFCLIMQYLQMYSAISIKVAKLPFQLCNLGAFLVLLSLVAKSKKLFNFTVVINVIGVLFAVACPDVSNKGLFYFYNMHFILEHTNLLVVPILTLLFGIFPRLDKQALKDCLIGFSIYFVSVWVLGTICNAIASKTGNGFWSANFLFMFDVSKASNLLGDWIKVLFTGFNLGYATIYPYAQFIVYVVFIAICVLLWLAIQLVYKVKDNITLKKSLKHANISEKSD